ncbi:MAG: hypothetical protein HOQ24_06530 [Mycobacteriaceae bacterium]|nr:hypothetical protein [Mycobacteriaceae bacterium]
MRRAYALLNTERSAEHRNRYEFDIRHAKSGMDLARTFIECGDGRATRQLLERLERDSANGVRPVLLVPSPSHLLTPSLAEVYLNAEVRAVSEHTDPDQR